MRMDYEEIRDKIMEILEEMDELSLEELVKMLSMREDVVREVLAQMREDGDIFEPRPGVYKLL
jgi:DeoR/GlpR family transcriptional regulator of sugar metabolism